MWPTRFCEVLSKLTSQALIHITFFLMIYASSTLAFFQFQIYHFFVVTGPFRMLSFLLEHSLLISTLFFWLILLNIQSSVPAPSSGKILQSNPSRLGQFFSLYLSKNCLSFFIVLISVAFHPYLCDSLVYYHINHYTPNSISVGAMSVLFLQQL